MLILLELLIAFAFLITLAFFRTKLVLCTPMIGLLLVGLTFFSHVSWWLLGPAWFYAFIISGVLLFKPLRLQFFSKPFLNYFQKTLPPMSETERIALEAGDVWWDGDLFSGDPNFEKMFSETKPELTDEEQSFLDNQVETLCSMLDEWQASADGDLSPATWDYIKKERFWGMVIPKKFGGLEFSPLAHSAVLAKIATRSVSATVTVMVPNSLGPAELLNMYGTDEQKQHYLPRLAIGEEIPGFALTGPEAGSDATSMPDSGIICKGKYEGKEVLGIRLNFDKRYITLAPVATVLGIAFKLFDFDGLLGDKEELGITLALVPRNTQGVTVGERHCPLGTSFSNGPIRGKDVFIPGRYHNACSCKAWRWAFLARET